MHFETLCESYVSLVCADVFIILFCNFERLKSVHEIAAAIFIIVNFIKICVMKIYNSMKKVAANKYGLAFGDDK